MYSDTASEEEEDDEELYNYGGSGGASQAAAATTDEEGLEDASEVQVGDYSTAYPSLAAEVLGDGEAEGEAKVSASKTSSKRRGLSEGDVPSKLFDWRRGPTQWPEGVELISAREARELIEAARAEAEKAAEKEKDDELGVFDLGRDDDLHDLKDYFDEPVMGPIRPAAESAFEDDERDRPVARASPAAAPAGSSYRRLKDGSWALEVSAGMRLKLDLTSLVASSRDDDVVGGRGRLVESSSAAAAAAVASRGRGAGGVSAAQTALGYYRTHPPRELLNEYTVTLDVKLEGDPPAAGLSLFQTALVHSEESRGGRRRARESDGEAIINASGGVGVFGTFGDVAKCRVLSGAWQRIVVAVKCASQGARVKKGELRTYVGAEPAAVVRHERIATNERFALRSDGLFLFSSRSERMMPGRLLLRACRVDAKALDDAAVRRNRARDKLFSTFEADNARKVDEQRRGLSLAKLFAKPRPCWEAPALVGAFGDAYVEGTTLEAASILAWSHAVLDLALRAALKEQRIFLAGMPPRAKAAASDAAHVIARSAPLMKGIVRLLRNPGGPQLASWLRALKKRLEDLDIGESLLLPLIVEGSELLAIVERATERNFTFVIIATNPTKALKHHAVSAAVAPPKIKYRTALVVTNVTKKNALCDVFWAAVYNLAIHYHDGDTRRFYELLIPFLTGKPLETSLVEADKFDAEARHAFAAEHPSVRWDEGDDDADFDRRAAAASRCGAWRSPQRSLTAYVRCIAEALHYLTLRRGCTDAQSKQVRLALRAQLATFCVRDVARVAPDQNGRRVVALVAKQLSYATAKLAGRARKNRLSLLRDAGTKNGETATSTLAAASAASSNAAPLSSTTGAKSDAPFDEVTPEAARRLAERLLAELDDVPAARDAAAAGVLDLNATTPTQWRDALAWRVDPAGADPGQAVLLRKYVAIDALQIKEIATTRTEAIAALRHCDRVCSLLDNQPHAVKNDKLLIIALVQHTLTCVVPIPRPRPEKHACEEDAARAGRAERRRLRLERRKRRQDQAEKQLADALAANKPKLAKATSMAQQRSNDKRGNPAPVEDDGTNWSTGAEEEARLSQASCIWDEPVEYAEQVEVLLTLRRIVEHFTAAVLSTQQDRALDAVCIVVPGVACAIADALLRRRATDHPSPFTAQLSGQMASGRQLGLRGFGLSVGTFATQTTSIECHVPALAVARASVLDYFLSPQQRCLEKIFAFEDRFELRPSRPLVALLRNLCREITLATPNPHLELCDALPCTSNLMKSFPEIAPYRDLAFFWKFFLNPDRTSFCNYVPTAAEGTVTAGGRGGLRSADATLSTGKEGYRNNRIRGSLRLVDRGSGQVGRLDCLQAQLTWGWSADEGGYSVTMAGKQLRCRPDPDVVDEVTGRKLPPERAPQHRYPSRADPSTYLTTPPPAKTEDDILYRPQLPGFSRGTSTVGVAASSVSRLSILRGKAVGSQGCDAASYRAYTSITSAVLSKRHADPPALGQRDSELLLSYLTVPYLRIPLVLTFFASEDRVHKLESPTLRGVLDAVLFEPGRHLPLGSTNVEPATVPTPHQSLLATANGHLLSELREAPMNVINNVIALLRGALALDTGAVCDADDDDFNASVQIILYTARLGARLESFVLFSLAAAQGHANCANANFSAIAGEPLRDLDVRDPTSITALDDGAAKLKAVLAEMSALFDDYLGKLDAQTRAAPGDEALVDRNSRLACDLHAHKLLINRNAFDRTCRARGLLLSLAGAALLGSFLFLTTRHTFNKATREEGRLVLPEFEVYELLQHVRRKLIKHVQKMTQYELDNVMQVALTAATSCTGATKDSIRLPTTVTNVLNDDFLKRQANRWSRINGDRNLGRYTVASTRTLTPAEHGDENSTALDGSTLQFKGDATTRARSSSMTATVCEVADSSELDVEIDIGIGQLTLRSKHLAALDPIVATNRDVRSVLGDATLQASLTERSVHRQIFKLVGLEHSIEWWHSAHVECPPLPDSYDREYDPAELFDSELWLPRVFEPVRRAFFDGPIPPSMQFLMPDSALPAKAEIAVLYGLHQRLGGPSKRIVVFRRRRCVHVYELISRGREWWWSMHLSTDVRFSLAELQPSASRRAAPFPAWWKHGAGAPYPVGVLDILPSDLRPDTGQGESVVIRRDASHPANLSGGVETYCPPRLLRGVIPDALLDDFRFWRDDSKTPVPDMRLRGYPLREDVFTPHATATAADEDLGVKDELIIVEFGATGTATLEVTGRVERTVRIERRSLAMEKRRFQEMQRLVATVERLGLVVEDDCQADLNEADREAGKKRRDAASSSSNKRICATLRKKKEAVVNLDFREGAEVEFRSRATESDEDKWIPCEVVKVDYEKRTYDLEFAGAYAYLHIQRAVQPEDVSPRGANDAAKAEGEGKWKFAGLTDSEDEWWRTDEETDDDDDDDETQLEHHKARAANHTKSRGRDPTQTSVAPLKPALALSLEQRLAVREFYERHETHCVEACEAALEAVASDARVHSPVPVADALAAAKSKLESEHDNATRRANDRTLYLLDLLHSRRGSRLYSLASTLVRIENLSNILAWTKANGALLEDGSTLPSGSPELTLIELPRLKLSFMTRPDHDNHLRLFSVDHVDLYVVEDQAGDAAAPLVKDIEHSLLLKNARGDCYALVPVIIPKRPPVRSQPFSTDLVLDREGTYEGLYDVDDVKFFLYSVHVSMSFLLPRGLASALYLLLLRLLKRDYHQAARLCDSVASDVPLSPDEYSIFRALGETTDDRHPDAHAVRLKISLVTMQSGHKPPWDLTTECSRYIAKIDHVSAECRLAATDELRLLESNLVAVDEESLAYDPRAGHEPWSLALCRNRRNTLRAATQGQTIAECVLPPREKSNDPWVLYTDECIFGISYAEMHDARSFAEYVQAKRCRHASPEDPEPANTVPPGGWLVVSAFTTSWSSMCQTMAGSVKALAPAHPAAIFIDVRVDSSPELHELAVAKGVTTFPSFLIERGDIQLAFVSAETAEKNLMALIQEIERNLGEHDVLSYQVWRRHENKLSKRGDAQKSHNAGDDDDEEDEDEEGMLWTWDVEAAGEGLRIESLGMAVALPLINDEDFEDERPVWESTRDDGIRSDWRTKWEPFPPATQTFLEIAFLSGKLYREMSVTDDSEVGGLHIYFSEEDIEIDSYCVSGFKGYMTSDYEDIRIRRRGPRVKVHGEESYLSKRQEAVDRRTEEWKQQYESYLARQRESRRGRDAVAARGTAPLQSGSGVHRWTVKWGHDPGSRGAADGVGIIAESSEALGPCIHPCLGGPDCDGGSLGLHANGELWVAGEKFCDGLSRKGALWTEGTRISVLLDTTEATISFSIDDDRTLLVQVDRIFERLGSETVYPAVAMCPIDAPASGPNPLQALVTASNGGSETGVGGCSDKLKEEAEKAHGKTANEGDEDGDEEEEQEAEDEQDMVEAIMAKEPHEQLAILELAQLTRISPEKIAKMNAKQRTELEQIAKPPIASVAIVDDRYTTNNRASSSKAQGKDKSGATLLGSSPPGTPVTVKGNEDDDDDEEQDGSSDAVAGVAAADDVPIEKIRWMRETPNGWVAHDAKVSAVLEAAKRAGRLEVSLVVDGAPYTFKLAPAADGSSEEPMQIPDGGGEATKLRRHFVSEGLRGSWEMLSLRYAPPASLYGVATLSLLEKVWANGETFTGERHGYGFLLLYALFQGDLRAHVCGSSWTSCGLWGWGNSSFGAAKFSKKQRTANDSHRLALLLTQLYSDRREKSVWASLINVLGRNRQLCVRLPKFRDTRRKRRGNVFNGWVDELEPKSPLAELFEQVVPVMQRLRRKRGAILFPPKPPHQALAAPSSRCRLPDDDIVGYLSGGVPSVELSDSARRSFTIPPIHSDIVLELAEKIAHPLALPTDDLAHAAARPPADIIDSVHWRRWVATEVRRAEKRQHDKLLLVACFDATWCPASRAVEPALRALALSTRTARFARLDVDDCDDLADTMGITTTPSIRFLRGDADEVVGRLDGGAFSSTAGSSEWSSSHGSAASRFRSANDDFAKRAVEALFEASTSAERATLADAFSMAFKMAADAPHEDDSASGLDQLRALREAYKVTLTSAERAAARSASRQLRIDGPGLADLATFPTRRIADSFVVTAAATRKMSELSGTNSVNLFPFDVVTQHEAAKTPAARAMLTRMRDDAKAHADAELKARSKFVRNCCDVRCFYGADASAANAALNEALETVRALEAALCTAREDDAAAVALAVPLLAAAANAVDDKANIDGPSSTFVLRRLAGRVPEIWPEFIFGALISSTGETDVQRLNPFIPAERVALTLRLVAVTMLRANRVGTLSRCAGDAVELRGALEVLRSLDLKKRRESEAVTAPQILQLSSLLATQLTGPRAYATVSQTGPALAASFDPRFLIFEFVKNIAIREEQVHIVTRLAADAENGVSRVKQMIMGAGKSSVVAPMLALMLADGERLVTCVVPKALLEMTRAQMRGTFSTIISKRVYTLHHDRSTVAHPQLRLSLQAARDSRAVVVATPTTIKSLMLSYIESLQRARDEAVGLALSSRATVSAALTCSSKQQPSQQHNEGCEHETPGGQARVLRGILEIFRQGVMLVDEVDLILHPLKSELNFPCGEKFPLDGAEHGERWLLPIALIDAVFYATSRRSSALEARGATFDVLERLAAAIDQGYAQMALQRLPHLTLLDAAYYHKRLKPLLAEIAWAWLTSQHLHGVDKDDVVNYLLGGVTPRSAVTAECKLVDAALKQIAVHDDSRPFLERAKSCADAQHALICSIFEIEGEIEDGARETAESTAKVDVRLAVARRRVTELECPPDASLDNSVVVWLSTAFGAGAAGAGGSLAQNPSDDAGALDASMSVMGMCSKLEEMLGVSVRRCDDAAEAVSRTIDLASSGRLRSVIVGGGEQRPVCGPTCTRNHFKDGPCVRCGREWGSHNGHLCQSGGRGAWPLVGRARMDSDDDFDGRRGLAVDPKLDLDAVINELVAAASGNERQPLSSYKEAAGSRVAVYVGHAMLGEKQRLSLWRKGVVAVENSESLVGWVQKLPRLRTTVEGEGAHENGDDASSDPGCRLENARARVESLERERARLVDAEEERRREQRIKASEAYDALVSRIDSQVQDIESILPGNEGFEDDVIEAHGVSRDAAMALAALGRGEVLTSRCSRVLRRHRQFLLRLKLAAKVMSKIASAVHKKLLNLAKDWLKMYLPHCLAKVNRVSFGLLSGTDIERAFSHDERMPRSRLKLAVPFVGKDVPSSASEFAHPDIVIGCTILAYRYSGLRRNDFYELADSLTADFVREIGPARDRPSSRRYEAWVCAAGGKIRGLDDSASAMGSGAVAAGSRSGIAAIPFKVPYRVNGKSIDATQDEKQTVVQLKFLQKSNEEQMEKLYELWRREPLAIHHYLQSGVFAQYMRSQRRKISASGQAIGGDLLFARRVGFSGTPSDLLPLELGSCQYQKCDDGKQLATVLDPEVCSIQELQPGWSVEDLLDLASSTHMRIHALIDTGALVTGRTNRDVASELLKRGLPWCDGVVYLDDDDKKQVLVRATMRSMPEEQCGVPLERRFAFYDQVHTTGMDIRHVANAAALVTLGKDMVWRDFAQGAFRMRGIGPRGQRVRVVVIPEVRRLVIRELALCRPDSVSSGISPLAELVAWLVINSLRAEQLQWSMLCAQNISNLYRKVAFRHLTGGEPEKEFSSFHQLDNNGSSVAQRALAVFEEPIDFSLEAAVPDPVPFEDRLRSLLEEHGEFASEQLATAARVLEDVGRYVRSDGQSGAKRLDTEQEREQEQEQQKEARARKDQQVEVEKFVEREYSRNEEAPRPWPLGKLSELPPEPGELGDREDGEHPFYPLADFSLRHHESLGFPRQLLLSRNYFRRSWMGLRRLKNVVVVLEWAPHGALAKLRPRDERERENELSEAQQASLNKAHRLFAGGRGATNLSRESLRDAVDVVEDVGRVRSDSELEELITEFGCADGGVDADGFARLVSCGVLHPEHSGRYWVALSLAEAETLRRALHVRRDRSLRAPPGRADPPEIALRYSPLATHAITTDVRAAASEATSSSTRGYAGDGGVVLDASRSWWSASLDGPPSTGATASEAALAHNAFRFFDGDVHFSEPALHALVRALRRSPPRRRERYFAANVGARRRLERAPRAAPLGRAFAVDDEYALVARRATAVFMRQAIQHRGLSWWAAFAAFDDGNTGALGPAEIYGALRYLGADFVSADDVLDFVALAANPEGRLGGQTADPTSLADLPRSLSFAEYVDALRVDADDDGEPCQRGEKPEEAALKVEPHGLEEIRDALLRRRRAAVEDAVAERARAEARAELLDRQLYDEELAEAERKHGAEGVNPRVDIVANVARTTFSFGAERKPLRFRAANAFGIALEAAARASVPSAPAAARGKPGCFFVPLDYDRVSRLPVPPLKCVCSKPLKPFDLSWERCSRCKPRDARGCTRICWSCYSRVCERCVVAHERGILAERADPSGKPTFLKCEPGSSFILQLPAKTFSTSNKIDPPALSCYTLTAEIKLERPPPRDSLAAIVRLTDSVRLGQALATERASAAGLYVDADGALVCTVQPDAQPANSANDARRVVFNRWCILTIVVNAERGSLCAYLHGKLVLSLSDIASARLRLGRDLRLFCGDKLAHARGAGCRQIILLTCEMDDSEVAQLALECARDNPEVATNCTRIQAIARARAVRRRLKNPEDHILEEVLPDPASNSGCTEDDGRDEKDADDDTEDEDFT